MFILIEVYVLAGRKTSSGLRLYIDLKLVIVILYFVSVSQCWTADGVFVMFLCVGLVFRRSLVKQD